MMFTGEGFTAKDTGYSEAVHVIFNPEETDFEQWVTR